MPFTLTADAVKRVLGAGCVFELEYAPAIRDATARRYFIANAAALLRLTRGRGVLLSSGAAHALELRGPHDAAALAALAGLGSEAALAAMSTAVAEVLVHAETRHARGGVAFVHVPPAIGVRAAATASRGTGASASGSSGSARGQSQAAMLATPLHVAGGAGKPAADGAPGPAKPWLQCVGARGASLWAPGTVAGSRAAGGGSRSAPAMDAHGWLLAAPPKPEAAAGGGSEGGSSAAGQP
jgi:hypothetical protein